MFSPKYGLLVLVLILTACGGYRRSQSTTVVQKSQSLTGAESFKISCSLKLKSVQNTIDLKIESNPFTYSQMLMTSPGLSLPVGNFTLVSQLSSRTREGGFYDPLFCVEFQESDPVLGKSCSDGTQVGYFIENLALPFSRFATVDYHYLYDGQAIVETEYNCTFDLVRE